jgi:enterochelin esterase-like enzyme
MGKLEGVVQKLIKWAFVARLLPIGLFTFLFFLAGCRSPVEALPTLAAVAAVASFTPTAVPVPPTFTPLPPPNSTNTHTPTPTPTDTPVPTFTPPASATPTRFAVPGFLSILPANALFLEEPPTSTDCNGSGLLFRSEFPSDVGGPVVAYHAYLPPCYGQDGRAYPTLILLPGSIQTDSHWPDLGLARYADEGIAGGRYPPFIAVMPYLGHLGNNTSGGDNSVEGMILNYFIPFVDGTFCTWEEARSIGGISRGAYWALMMAFRRPELFTAVSGHSSQLSLGIDDARYNPLVTYAEADLSQLHIWLDWGENDFLRRGSQAMTEALAEAGIAHEGHVFGGGHNDRYWQVHLPDYLDWHAAVWPQERESYPAC